MSKKSKIKRAKKAQTARPEAAMNKPTPSTPSVRSPKQAEQMLRIDLFGMTNKKIPVPDNKPLLEAIEKRRKNKIITLVLREGLMLQNNIIVPLFEVLRDLGKEKKLDVFIFTTGGATEVPWRIISLIREFCDQYFAIIPFICLSAGTHIALGANELVMGEISTLSPVDPTRKHKLLPKDKNDNPIDVSVEDLKHCIKFITQQLQNDEKYSPTDMASIVNELFDHIEPLAIGAIEQSYMLSRLITEKALETHLDREKDKDKIKNIVDRIGGEYYSHSFPITRRDVELDLGLKVQKPDSETWDAIWQLYSYYQDMFGRQGNASISLKDTSGKEIKQDFIVQHHAFIDIVKGRRVLTSLAQLEKNEKGDIIEKTVFNRFIEPAVESAKTTPVVYQSRIS